MYGGGGINPDVKLPAQKTNHFQDVLLQKYAFFNFAKHYLVSHKVDKNLQVDENVMQEFRRFMDDQKIPFTEAELADTKDWTQNNIKAELFISQFGQQAGFIVRAEGDPNVQKALDLLPKAKKLADNARKVIAERNQARATAATQSQ